MLGLVVIVQADARLCGEVVVQFGGIEQQGLQPYGLRPRSPSGLCIFQIYGRTNVMCYWLICVKCVMSPMIAP